MYKKKKKKKKNAHVVKRQQFIYGHAYFWPSQNCHFYIYILMTCDAKFVSYSENFSRKFYCPMIKNFGPVSPEQLWNKFIPTEFETKKPLRFRVGYISQIFLKIDFLKDYLTKFQIFRFSNFLSNIALLNEQTFPSGLHHAIILCN